MSNGKHYITSIKASAELCRRRVSKLFGRPSRGVTVGGDPAGPEAFTPGAHGWTEHEFSLRKHKSGVRWATRVVNPDEHPDRDRLDDLETGYLRSKHDNSEELDETWDEDEDEGGEKAAVA